MGTVGLGERGGCHGTDPHPLPQVGSRWRWRVLPRQRSPARTTRTGPAPCPTCPRPPGTTTSSSASTTSTSRAAPSPPRSPVSGGLRETLDGVPSGLGDFLRGLWEPSCGHQVPCPVLATRTPWCCHGYPVHMAMGTPERWWSWGPLNGCGGSHGDTCMVMTMGTPPGPHHVALGTLCGHGDPTTWRWVHRMATTHPHVSLGTPLTWPWTCGHGTPVLPTLFAPPLTSPPQGTTRCARPS